MVLLLYMDENIFPRPCVFNVEASPLLGSYFYDELIACIESSREYIKSVQYQWKWNIHERHSKVQCLGAAIIRARARGVKVSVILNQESPRRNIDKINQVTADELARGSCEIKMLRTASILHTKLWIIDGLYTFTGSHNISTRSLAVNEETSVKIKSKEYANFMGLYFSNLWNSR
jgi:phosphatidylserine/phosphatidylglycerophosphate/cardiolipin synthase-like enzyme